MDPVKEPMCAVCGATTDLVGRPEAGWVCAVSGPCIDRSTKRTWLSLAANARAIMGELRAEDPNFGLPSDIPAEPFLELSVMSSGDGEVRVYQIPPDHPLAILHPAGRCTCGGEGECDWCRRPCPACGVPTIEHGDTCISMQRACDRCGGLQNVVLLRYGWACDFCLGGDVMPDYAALGYPEAEFGKADLDYAAYVVGFASRGIAASVIAYQLNDSEKDISASTDIVDSGDTDSYK